MSSELGGARLAETYSCRARRVLLNNAKQGVHVCSKCTRRRQLTTQSNRGSDDTKSAASTGQREVVVKEQGVPALAGAGEMNYVLCTYVAIKSTEDRRVQY
jgi:hypothetical protein